MTSNNLKASIDTRIQDIAKASKVLFVQLGTVSRELLMYVPDSKDIGAVNRLLDVLTAHDRGAVTIFFQEFLPWKFDDVALHFVGMLSGERRINEMALARDAFLKTMIKNADGKEHEATFWDWAKENIQPAERRVDFNANIVSLIQRATAEKNKDGTENKYRITHEDIISDVLNSGVTLDEMMSVVSKALDEKKAADKAAERAAKSNVANENKPKRERKPKADKTMTVA